MLNCSLIFNHMQKTKIVEKNLSLSRGLSTSLIFIKKTNGKSDTTIKTIEIFCFYHRSYRSIVLTVILGHSTRLIIALNLDGNQR